MIEDGVKTMSARDKYTDPELRDEVKEEIHNGDKGGAPGKWSARKVQHPSGDIARLNVADRLIGADDGFRIQEARGRLHHGQRT